MMYHVMIIEDDPMVASINRQYVEATPSFQTDRVFKSGAEALEYLKDHTTDLIILDYYTPLMNGDVFIDRLHAMGKTPAIIMVSSANDTDIVRSLLSRGVLDYLVKPFEYARFRTALERFAAQQEYLQGARPSLSQNAIDQLFAGPFTRSWATTAPYPALSWPQRFPPISPSSPGRSFPFTRLCWSSCW